MKRYTCTYVESPEINPNEANPLGEIQIEANNNREAGAKALALPLPEGADRLCVHVCPHDLSENAGFETYEPN